MKKNGTMGRSDVPWCDYAWTPVEGCSKASEGCDNCYAASMAHRFGKHWGSPWFNPSKIAYPEQTLKPGRVFVCPTSDLFHEAMKIDDILAIFGAMQAAPWHTYIILTKRPSNMQLFFHTQPAPDNWWIGTTCENQARFDERFEILMRCDAKTRFLSLEPLLGPIQMTERLNCHDGFGELSWVISGPETGKRRRPCDPDWIKGLAGECERANIRFFDKRDEDDPLFTRRDWPEDGQARLPDLQGETP